MQELAQLYTTQAGQRMMFSSKQHVTAIIMMVTSTLFVTLNSLLAKWLSNSFGLTELVLLRFLFPSLCLTLLCCFDRFPAFDRKEWPTYISRSIFVVLTQFAFIDYLIYGSLLDATVLFMSSPLFVPIISRCLYGVSLTLGEYVALLIGFSGVMLVIKPDRGLMEWHAIIGLSAGFFNACSQTAFHKLVKKSGVNSANFYVYWIITLIAFVVYCFAPSSLRAHLHGPLKEEVIYLLLFILLASTGIGNQYFRGWAYQRVKDATNLTPLLYLVIVFSGLVDWLFLHHVPDHWSFFGALLIVIGGVHAIQSKAKVAT